jgi:hypothetical protein
MKLSGILVRNKLRNYQINVDAVYTETMNLGKFICIIYCYNLIKKISMIRSNFDTAVMLCFCNCLSFNRMAYISTKSVNPRKHTYKPTLRVLTNVSDF